jgi:hypothetical protein
MVKHIVMFRLPEKYKGEERTKNILEIKQRLEALPAQIETIKFFRVGLNFTDLPTAFELVIDSDFENKEGLQYYAVHQAHLEVVKFLRSLDAEKVVVDYEY